MLTRAITDLPALVAALPDDERRRFERLIHVTASEGELVPPPEMRPWIERHFGSVVAVARQRVVKTTNLVTYEGTVFNPLRAARPIEATEALDLERAIAATVGDPFCAPLVGTPADLFGRVRGRHAVTASNVARYDAWHAVVVFDEHHPLRFTAETLADLFDLGRRWAEEVLRRDPAARYFFLLWNCLWKAGASILHGHAQIACTRGRHYARVEGLRAAAERYRAQYGSSYVADLLAAHRALGLTLERGDTQVMVSLTPVKEKEVWLVAPGLTDDLAAAAFQVLDTYVWRLGVRSFNLALLQPPLRPAPEDWAGFPTIVRIVDRGPPESRTADVAAMELYAASVVASDPFALAAALRGAGVGEPPQADLTGRGPS